MTQEQLEVRQATIADVAEVAALFDGYRKFYRAASDIEGARRFLAERLANRQSVIILASVAAKAAGFTQLYPSFSSLSMAPVLVLNDLFVSPEARGHGVGRALLDAAAEYGRQVGAVRLVLQTEATNTPAQALYERAGWKRELSFWSYNLSL
jgi:ribosomal protein S18 acetylase RimI-like enzyme